MSLLDVLQDPLDALSSQHFLGLQPPLDGGCSWLGPCVLKKYAGHHLHALAGPEKS